MEQDGDGSKTQAKQNKTWVGGIRAYTAVQ
jgi:hypothetical protein